MENRHVFLKQVKKYPCRCPFGAPESHMTNANKSSDTKMQTERVTDKPHPFYPDIRTQLPALSDSSRACPVLHPSHRCLLQPQWLTWLPCSSPAGDPTSSITPLQTLHSTHSQKDLSKHKSVWHSLLNPSSSYHQMSTVSLRLGQPDWFMFQKGS